MRTPTARRHIDPADFPASLLWTHQLRREHKALVARLDQLESKLASKDSGDAVQSLITRLDGFEAQVGEMKGELGRVAEIRRLVEELRAWRDREEIERQERGRIMEEREVERGENLREELTGKIRVLEDMARDLKEKMESEVILPRAHPTNPRDYGTPPSAQPVRDISTRNKDMNAPSTVSGTPSTTGRCSHDLSGPPSVSGSLTGFSEASTIPGPRETPDCEAQAHEPLSIPIHSGSQVMLSSLRQDCHTLQSYLELGESVLAMFPRRHEAKVVEAFWEGVADTRVKNSMEERMERDGWTWNIAREVVTALIRQVDAQKPNEQGGHGEPIRRRKKRRVIPLVWSMEGEDGGPL